MKKHGPRPITSLAILSVLIGSFLIASPAQAGSNCVYDATTKRVTVTVHPGVAYIAISRDGNEIQIQPGVECTNATRFNTNKIVVNDPAGHDVQVVLGVGQGALKPGLKNEPGRSDEIEVLLNLEDGTNEVGIDGGPAKDRFTVGITPGNLMLTPTRINLNSNENRRVDADVIVKGSLPSITLEGHAKRDRLSAHGGADTGVPHPGEASLYGYGKKDTLIGGDGADRLFGSSGGDVVKGKRGPDDLYGDEGDDLLNGGPGGDECNGGTGTNTLKKCEVTPP